MIYCPKCGTANRDGSRFCNECGEKLGTHTHVTCPQCGTLNPAQNVFCSECRGRLVPTVASPSDGETTAGGQEEQPAATSTPESEDEIPAWLSELGATLTEQDKLAASEPEEDAAEIPDWLRDLRDSLPTEPEIVGAEWLTGVPPTPAEEGAEPVLPATGAEDEQVPDWLSELHPEAQADEPTPPTTEIPEEREEPTGWLDELRSSVTGEEPSPTADEAEEEELPAWLTELQPDAGEAEEEESPAWLAELQPEAGEAEEEESPSWLTELQPEAGEAEEEEAPDWLAELQSEAKEEEPSLVAGEAEEEEEPAWLAELQSEAGEAEEEEAPAWLTELQSEAKEEEPSLTAGEAEEEEAPAWLTELQPEVGEAEEEEAPAWLAELQPEVEEEEPSLTAGEAEEEEAPAWLAELQPEAGEAEEEEAPAWLAELQPEAEEEEPSLTADKAEEEEAPAWLAELQSEAEEEEPDLTPTAFELEQISDQVSDLEPSPAEEEPISAIPETEAGEIPDWLAELQPPAIEVEPEPEPPVLEDVAEETTADWLAQLLGSSPEEEPLLETLDEEARPAEAAPDWVAELQVEAPEETTLADEEIPEDAESADWLVTPTPSPEEAESLARAEIPAWLMALKPSELREEGEDQDQVPSAEEPVEGTGLLAGLHGTLPAEMLIAQPRAASPAEALGAPPADTPQARLFADIVGRPPVAAPKEIVSPPARALALIPRLIIFVALIAAVSLPLLLQEPLFPRTISAAPVTEDMYDTIERLDSNASVLVAFDYDPSTSGEMNTLAQALVGHLMDRGVKVVVVSLLPAGPATAQSVLDSLAAERSDYADSYGSRYANLGYLPGQATAVRLMGLSLQTALPRDFQGTQVNELSAMEDLDRIQEFDLVVELAATQETLRWWIEQARMPYDIPLGAGVSASIDPFARPYYETDSQQLVGMVSGVPGAATYEALRTGQDSPGGNLAARLDSQLAGHLIFVLVLLVGNGVYLARRGSGREH
jgi:chitodextrinase